MCFKKIFCKIALLLCVYFLSNSNSYADVTKQNANQLNNKAITLLSLKAIMADPDWMGNSPESAIWSNDERFIYYQQKEMGHQHNNYFKWDFSNQHATQLKDDELLTLASQAAVKNQSATKGVFIYQDDLYLVDLKGKQIKPIIIDEQKQSNASFISENKFSFMQGYDLFIYDLELSVARQIASFKTEAEPQSDDKKNYLEQSQPRLFKVIKQKNIEESLQKKRRDELQLNPVKTWYLGDDVDIKTFSLSPDANWLVLGTVQKQKSTLNDNMPEFVTADGYVNNRKVRALVGSEAEVNEKLYLIDLVRQQKSLLDTASLPGINDDPLSSLKKKAATKIGYQYIQQQGPREIYVYDELDNGGVAWSNNSQQLAINLFSYDNKDRWIIGLDVKDKKIKTLHWLTDSAWVNDWTFNEFGWLPDNETLYYLSEEDGYSHIYIKQGKRKPRQLTQGRFEVSDLTVNQNGSEIYFKANVKAPGIYEIYRVSVKDGKIEALTDLNGMNDYVLSPSEEQLLITHSTTTSMPELYLQSINKNNTTVANTPQQITHTSSAEFNLIQWQQPQIVEVASSHIKRSIYGRFYPSRSEQKAGDNNKKPAVIFVHGAGYLQNSHQGWSGYFREFMFHNLLTEQGYTVLDLDYRASKGYGRDWRTAIYRQMGTPELEDLEDGVKWLIENANVDPQRIGVYGGSYGGFMTFMALFKSPDLFAAGAALRPVSDWAHYNHGYTSNILNTPEVDPEAYEKSSPIEYAQGLKKPLLIAHGMVDDNVFFKDSVRLVQRLIELEKTPYFETAIYPVERHGFQQPSSWLDEYTRIYQLFEDNLN